jgi:hypothetical protein
MNTNSIGVQHNGVVEPKINASVAKRLGFDPRNFLGSGWALRPTGSLRDSQIVRSLHSAA